MSDRDISFRTDRNESLRIALWLWTGCGLLALLLCPPLRQRDPLLGWLPFWCVVAPLIDLALIERSRLLALSHAFLVRVRHRRRPLRRQALRRSLRIRQRHARRLRPLLAALLSR